MQCSRIPRSANSFTHIWLQFTPPTIAQNLCCKTGCAGKDSMAMLEQKNERLVKKNGFSFSIFCVRACGIVCGHRSVSMGGARTRPREASERRWPRRCGPRALTRTPTRTGLSASAHNRQERCHHLQNRNTLAYAGVLSRRLRVRAPSASLRRKTAAAYLAAKGRPLTVPQESCLLCRTRALGASRGHALQMQWRRE